MDSLKIIEKLIKDRANERDIVQYLSDNIPVTELARDYYTLYCKHMEQGFIPMRISQSDFDKHFRIIGIKTDGSPETRGRKKTI